MIGNIAKSMAVAVVRRRIGAPAVGPVTNMLIMSGLSLALDRRRRVTGIALAAAGAALLWHQRAGGGDPPAAG